MGLMERAQNQRRKIEMFKLVQLFHVVLIAPFLIYVGLYRDAVPDMLFRVLGLVAFGLLAYHMFRAYVNWRTPRAWINLLHVGIIAPLLLTISYYKKDTPRALFEILIMLGVAAWGYHGLYLIRDTPIVCSAPAQT